MISVRDVKEYSRELNILYVEEEQSARNSMQNTLFDFFNIVFTATNGQEAFEIFKKEKIDIVLTDIYMPIMNGLELINSIHSHDNPAPLIIVASAHHETKLLSTLINVGINQFLNKPVQKEHLLNAFYKLTKIKAERDLLVHYESQLEQELESMERKNKILEQKINQIAFQTNQSISKNSSLHKTNNVKTHGYYETLLVDDKDELKELSMELDNFITMMFQGTSLQEEYLYRLSDTYKKYSSILNGNGEFAELSNVIYVFSQRMISNKEKFMKNLAQTGIYFESLQLTLENFRQNVWEKEAEDPKFYNASLVNDIQLVIDFLEGAEIRGQEIEFF